MSRPFEDWEPLNGASTAILIGGKVEDGRASVAEAMANAISETAATASNPRPDRDMGPPFGSD
jgi:hypothetical protein